MPVPSRVVPSSSALITLASSGSIITDKSVSRKHVKVHCYIFVTDEDEVLPALVYVTGRHTSNGTYIYSPSADSDATKLLPDKPFLLQNGDCLRIGKGNTRCVLRLNATDESREL